MSYTRLLWERKCILFYESGKFSMLSQVLPAESVGFLTPGQHISLFPITKLQTIIQMTIAKKKIFCENAKKVVDSHRFGWYISKALAGSGKNERNFRKKLKKVLDKANRVW